jgi:hypothetical protein
MPSSPKGRPTSKPAGSVVLFFTHKEFIASLHKEARKLSRKKTKRSV